MAEGEWRRLFPWGGGHPSAEGVILAPAPVPRGALCALGAESTVKRGYQLVSGQGLGSRAQKLRPQEGRELPLSLSVCLWKFSIVF